MFKILANFGIDYADSIINYAKNLDDAMRNSPSYLSIISKKFLESI